MNIELNKVTWYSKIAAVVLFVGVFGLGFYLGKQYPESSAIAPEDATKSAVEAPKTPTATTPAPKPSTPTVSKGNNAALVTMTKSGFSPSTVTVTVGQSVRFVNGTDSAMRIYSVVNLGSPVYPGFDQQKSGGRGSTFDFLFNKAGTWGYYNMNGNPAVTGTVVVKPQ